MLPLSESLVKQQRPQLSFETNSVKKKKVASLMAPRQLAALK